MFNKNKYRKSLKHNKNNKKNFNYQNYNKRNDTKNKNSNTQGYGVSADGQFKVSSNKNKSIDQVKTIKRGVVFFNTVDEALKNINDIKQKKSCYDELSIVVAEECEHANAYELQKYGKFYSGKVWVDIHKRRLEENWYQ